MSEATEKPTLAEAIEWGKRTTQEWCNERGPRLLSLRRLVEAGEFEEKWRAVWDTKPEAVPETARGILLAERYRQLQALRRQLDALEKEKAEKERELERLRGMLDRLLEQSDPPEIPAPTEAEVEKVAENLYLQHTTSSGLIKKAFCVLYGDEKIRWRSVARHVIERGYRIE